MDDAAIRLKCLEIANAEHPGTRLMRAEELYKWVKSESASAPLAPALESSGGPTASPDAKPVAGPGFKLTPEQLSRLDEGELKRMSES